MNQTYKAIFFDLDGTLLPMELQEFLEKYMGAIGAFAAKKGMDAEAFQKGLHTGIKAMTTDDTPTCNADIFWDMFFGIVPEDRDRWITLFLEFYEYEFGLIGKDVEANPFVARTIATLREKGYPLILATMPMFPRRAVEWRCEWAGVDPAVFDRITTFENSASVKPKPAYFEENLKAIGLKGEEVLMVGNNTREDLACLPLGMDAYLVTDHIINPNDFDIANVKHGTFEEFYAWVQTLPECVEPAQNITDGPVGE